MMIYPISESELKTNVTASPHVHYIDLSALRLCVRLAVDDHY